jgi:iron complex outermembrane receptor protein
VKTPWLLIAAFVLLVAPSAWGGPTTAPSNNPSAALLPDDFNEPIIPDLSKGSAPSGDAPELMLYKDMPVILVAGKREQTQREAPASVSVVTAEDIDLYGFKSLADVLRTQRGFYLNYDGLNWFAGVRGFLRPDEWNARILVLVDGRPTRELIYDQTHLDQDFVVPMEAVERVEIIRGPGSSLYGPDAVFGVINVVTKQGSDVNGVQVKAGGGTKDSGRINTLMGFDTKNGWDILADLSGSTSPGDKDIQFDDITSPALNYGHIINSDYEGVYSGFFKATKDEFTATGDFESRQKSNRDATYDVSWFDPGAMNEQRTNVTFKFDHEVEADQHLRAMAYYGDYRYRQYYQYDDSTGAPEELYNTTAYDNWVGEEVDYDWQVTRQLHLLAGVDGTQAISTVQLDYDTVNGIDVDQKPSYNDAGVFVDGEYKVTRWMDITLGGRMDQIQRIGTTISPRAAVVLTPTKGDTFKLLYGRAFRPPNLYEMFYSSPGSDTPNPNLNPEICDTYEIDWDHQFTDGWHTTLDGYIWRLQDAIEGVALANGSEEFQNVGTDWARGVEAEVDKRWGSGAQFRAYGSVDRADQDGDTLTHSPQWIVGTSFAIPVINSRTFLSIAPQIVAGMKSDLEVYTKPTYITNIVLTSHNVMQNLDMQVGVYNLFGNYARLPQDNQFDQVQPTLRYPYPELMGSVTYKF